MRVPKDSVVLIQHSSLREHEEIKKNNLKLRIKKMKKKGFYKPIIVDSTSKVILDGHHKWNAARILGLYLVPVILVDYINDESITVSVWDDCTKEIMTKKEVIEMGISENLFSPKTSKHYFSFPIHKIAIPLETLQNGGPSSRT